MSDLEVVRAIASREPQLELLVLYGSRARGDARHDSDWDFAYLADDDFDVGTFRGTLVRALACDDVDLVDLSRASGQLRYRVAADGITVGGRAGAFERFWTAAVFFWLDVQDVVRAEYEAALQRLPP